MQKAVEAKFKDRRCSSSYDSESTSNVKMFIEGSTREEKRAHSKSMRLYYPMGVE